MTYNCVANRSLEDIDDYYRNDPPLIVTGDRDAIGSKRPLKYVNKEEETVGVARRESIARRESLRMGVTEEKDRSHSTTHVE